jgi:hypothetical protein
MSNYTDSKEQDWHTMRNGRIPASMLGEHMQNMSLVSGATGNDAPMCKRMQNMSLKTNPTITKICAINGVHYDSEKVFYKDVRVLFNK